MSLRHPRGPHRDHDRDHTRDRGAVDASVELLIGAALTASLVLLVVEAAAHWHTRNVLADAAADGVRVAAAHDGSCAAGVDVAESAVARHGGSWAEHVRVGCTDGAVVTVTVTGRGPGLVASLLGHRAVVSSSTPKER